MFHFRIKPGHLFLSMVFFFSSLPVQSADIGFLLIRSQVHDISSQGYELRLDGNIRGRYQKYFQHSFDGKKYGVKGSWQIFLPVSPGEHRVEFLEKSGAIYKRNIQVISGEILLIELQHGSEKEDGSSFIHIDKEKAGKFSTDYSDGDALKVLSEYTARRDRGYLSLTVLSNPDKVYLVHLDQRKRVTGFSKRHGPVHITFEVLPGTHNVLLEIQGDTVLKKTVLVPELSETVNLTIDGR